MFTCNPQVDNENQTHFLGLIGHLESSFVQGMFKFGPFKIWLTLFFLLICSCGFFVDTCIENIFFHFLMSLFTFSIMSLMDRKFAILMKS